MQLHRFAPGMRFTLGPVQVTADEIKTFARVADPLPIHLDDAVAAASRFGALIASGLHPFTKLYTDYFLPMAQHTMVAGMNLNATFHKPVFANMPFQAELLVESVKPNPAKGTQVIVWRWEIQDTQGQPLQTTVATILHTLSPDTTA